MASIDWQTSLSTSFRFLLASVAHLLAALFWALSWIVLNVVTSAPRFIYGAASIIATPLTYPLYYIWRVFVFVLSPVWVMWRMFIGTGAWLVGLIVKFKYLYIYFAIAGLIGFLAACMLHGTSSVLFSLLRISHSSESADQKPRLRLQALDPQSQLDESAPKEEEYDDAASSSSTDLENLLSDPGLSQHRADRPVMTNRLFEQAYRQAKSTRLSPIKPSRRFRGLLAQTIHEESSESE